MDPYRNPGFHYINTIDPFRNPGFHHGSTQKSWISIQEIQETDCIQDADTD